MITPVMGAGVSIQIIGTNNICLIIAPLSLKFTITSHSVSCLWCGYIYGTIAKKITTSPSFLFSVFRLVQNSSQINLQSAVRVNISKYQNAQSRFQRMQCPEFLGLKESLINCFMLLIILLQSLCCAYPM